MIFKEIFLFIPVILALAGLSFNIKSAHVPSPAVCVTETDVQTFFLTKKILHIIDEVEAEAVKKHPDIEKPKTYADAPGSTNLARLLPLAESLDYYYFKEGFMLRFQTFFAKPESLITPLGTVRLNIDFKIDGKGARLGGNGMRVAERIGKELFDVLERRLNLTCSRDKDYYIVNAVDGEKIKAPSVMTVYDAENDYKEERRLVLGRLLDELASSRRKRV